MRAGRGRPTVHRVEGESRRRTMETTEHTDVLIVGAGQSGLALGYHLQRRGRLPGMPFPAGRTAYPTKDEMADYLETYAARFELPLRLGTRVEALTPEDGRFVAH